MPKITITESIFERDRGRSKIYSYRSSEIDGIYASGEWVYDYTSLSGAHRVYWTMEQNRQKALENTLAYLGPKFFALYGREISKYDIEGYGDDPTLVQAKIEADMLMREQEAAAKKLMEDLAQIELQKQMLSSPTALWASQDAYSQAMDSTGANIEEVNVRVDQFNADLKKTSLDGIIAPVAEAPPVKGKADMTIGIILLPIAIIIAIVMLIKGR